MLRQASFNFQRIVPVVKRNQRLVARVGVVLGLVALFLVSGLGSSVGKAFAASSCASGTKAYSVRGGDTLSKIASRYNTTWQKLASENHLSNPNVIFPGETICIGKTATTTTTDGSAVAGTYNSFPYGQCTWWADQRYHDLTGVYVPWYTNSDAWQWTQRAYQYHWHVSSKPAVGAIMDLQAWTQGAYEYGHVAIVEKILSNGHVMASNMNWGGNGSNVVDVEFSPASGVTFITF